MDRRELSGYAKPLTAVVCNTVLSYAAFMLCRLAFMAENWKYFADDMTAGLMMSVLKGGLVFDTSAIAYTNILYMVLALLPLHLKDNRTYAAVTKWTFVVPNSAAIIINLADSVYFQYTNRRTTTTVFKEFSNEGNLGSIFLDEMLSHWYLVLLAAVMILGLCKLYRGYRTRAHYRLIPYYASQLLSLGIAVVLTIAGMRGGVTTAVRPITVSNANQYVSRPIETALVLNTPFSLYRTIGKDVFAVPSYYGSRAALEQAYTPLHHASDTAAFTPRNVVVLILESFGSEYSALRNPDKGSAYGYTPFLDSLSTAGLTFRHSFANGRKSIDGMPSVLSGIPMFVEPFFLTPASLNRVSGIAGELGKKGYRTAFFHGADNGSMGFEAFARATGFTEYYGRDEYGDDKDFDGTWAIWDRPFFRYFAEMLDTLPQPFAAGLFSASSHHPFRLPAGDEGRYKEGTLPIHRCIMYTDDALRGFFATARTMDWYANTLFVITADHTSQSDTPRYLTDAGVFEVPIVFYCPSDTTLRGCRDAIAQQTDIMPTVLGYLHYDNPYVAFGCDLLRTADDETWAVNYINGIYQYFKGRLMLQFDGTRSVALYDFAADPMLRHDLLGQMPDEAAAMEARLKAIIQQYMERMTADALTAGGTADDTAR